MDRQDPSKRSVNSHDDGEPQTAHGLAPAGGELANALLHRKILQRRAQRKAAADAGPETSLSAAEAGLSGTPQSLPHQEHIQAAFGGHDVSQIQAHVGGPAASASAQMGALAYATGNSVAFAETPDLHTAAHEAAHVVQQRAGVQLSGGVGEVGDRYEQHADAVADAVVAGRSAAPLLDGMASPGQTRQGGAVQHNKPPQAKSVGRKEATDFGTYWVVPDGTSDKDAAVSAQGEIIREAAFTTLKNTWDTIKAGTTSIVITESDKNGGAHAGFKDKVLTCLGKLMSKPTGRKLVTGLASGAKSVTIRPSAAKVGGGANTNATGGLGAGSPARTAGTGANSTIDLDPNVGDADVKVYDAAGNEISDPVYIFLGHEMIHARHIAAGTVDMGAPADASYDIKEEETTIATGDLSENDLRSEQGLTARHGHGGVDKRP